MNHCIRRFILILIALSCSISLGLDYGIDNQNTYLIHGFSKINPDFLTADWLTRETIHYHSSFSVILMLVNYLELPTAYSLTLIEIILRLVAMYFIYLLIKTITPNNAFSAFLLCATLVTFEGTRSVADSYIFSSMLQPSSLGASFFVIALYFYIRQKYLYSGLIMALSGFMHTNFLLLGFILFTISHLLLGKRDLFKRFSFQFIPMLVVLIFSLPFLLAMISVKDGEVATYIFQFIRSPHHYVPVSFLDSFLLFYGWMLLGIWGLKTLNIQEKLYFQLNSLFISFLISITVATVLTTLVFIPVFSKLFFWRLAPFAVLIAQILFLTSALQSTLLSYKGDKPQKITFISAVLGIALLYTWYVPTYGLLSTNTLFLTAFLTLIFLIYMKIKIKFLPINFFSSKTINAISFIVSLVVISNGVKYSINKSTAIYGIQNKNEHTLFEWAKTTDKLTRFLIPPGLGNFRLHTERAVVVDWKSTPVDPEGLIEWYRRIQDISGKTALTSYKESDAGYKNMDITRLRHLKDRYEVNYAVVEKSAQITNIGLRVDYENEQFVVFNLDVGTADATKK